MLLVSTVAAVYDRRWSTKGRLVLDILKCSAGVSPAMVSGSAHASGTQAHASRGDAKQCGREPMAHSRTGEPVCTRPRRPCSRAFFIIRRLSVSPDCERHTNAGLQLGAYDSESETPAELFYQVLITHLSSICEIVSLCSLANRFTAF
jgi:hypothetical protein